MTPKVEVNDENTNSINLGGNSNYNIGGHFPKLTKNDVQERIKNLQHYVEVVNNSPDPSKRLEATIEFRRMLSVENCPPIQEVIDSGVVPRIMQFLSYHNEQKLQFEAAWAITNIASGTTAHTKCVVELGGIGCFVQLLGSPNAEVREQAVWALGNIA